MTEARCDDRASVLFVDPHRCVQVDLSELLTNCIVTVVTTGFDALREINARAFDVYVCDLWLPDWSGLQLCRAVRKNDPAAAVVLYTRRPNDRDRARAARAGAAEYLSAPLAPTLLRERVFWLAARARANSVRARPALEHALNGLLSARSAGAVERARGDEAAAARTMARIAAAPARRAFLRAGGTASHFERWWTEAFAAAWTRARTPSRPKVSETCSAKTRNAA